MDKEKYFDTEGIKGRYQKAIAPETVKALIVFCEQEPEFEQAVEQSDKSFQECLDHVVNGIGNSISDLEVYSRAVKFYFPVAELHFSMKIDLCGNTGYTPPPVTMTEFKPKHSGLSISLDDLLDF